MPLNTGSGPLLYTAAAPATRMQIITRPLSGIPAEANIKLTSRERFRLLIAFVVTILFLALLSTMIMIGNGLPDLGLISQPNAKGQQVVTWVVPLGISYYQGVRPGDIVLSEERVGDNFVATIQKATNSVTNGLDASVPPSTATPTEPITVTTELEVPLSALQRWSFIILSLIFIAVGGSVYVKARQRVAASAFYGFCVASAVCLVVSPTTYLGYGPTLVLMFVAVAVWAGSFAFFFLKFPVKAGRTKGRHRLMVSSVLVGGVVTIGFYLAVYALDPSLYGIAQLLGYTYLTGCAALGLASMGRALFKERSPEVRQQMTIVLGGTALAIGPSVVLGVLPSLFGLPSVRVDLTALTLGIMPLSFAYAITQGQMLGVRNFIRRGVVYVLMGFGVLLAFSLVVGALSTIVPEGWQHDEVGLIGFSLFVFMVALSYGYVQRWVERQVDRYIYHDAYDYKEALLQFSAQLAAEQNLHTLADELVQRTCRMMNLSCGVLLLSTPTSHESNPRAEMIHNGIDPSGETVDALWGALRNSEFATTGSGNQPPHIFNPSSATFMSKEAANGSNPVGGTTPLRVVPYARYGDFADWLIDGLHYELSQLGIRLDEADAPMQLIYFNQAVGQGEHEDTSHLKTAQLHEDSVVLSGKSLNSGVLRSTLTTTGSLSSYAIGGNGQARTHTNGKSHPPTSKLDIESIRSFLGVPLWTRSRFVGVLCLGGKKTGERFTKDDLSLLSTLGSQAALAIYNAQLYEAREQALLDTIGALAHAIEAKDGYTIQHCENMTGRAVTLAQVMGLPAKEVENIRMGATLHDIGKIGIPDAVLNKPGKLTADEYDLMKQHAAIGARIVQSVGALQDVVPIVRYHQERYDGSGYPEGLKGEAIPMGARIIGVVDTYGAMTEDRVYRATPGHEKAIAELTRLAGQQFDPVVVNAFVRLLEERPDLAELPVGRLHSYIRN
ncbi:MAG: HD domain-containing phosphohydrolase [Chloroflexota bacterium]